MTEYVCVEDFNNKYECKACLQSFSTLNLLTIEQENLYHNLVLEPMGIKMEYIHMCKLCQYMWQKIMKFVKHCQDSAYILSRDNQNINSPTKFQDFVITQSNVYSNLDEIKPEPFDCPSDDNQNDDDLPLVLLKSEGDNKDDITKNIKKKKRIKSKKDRLILIEKTSINEKNSKYSMELNKKTKIEKEKHMREGFSSRMVQETEEYVVIKLSKEQVIQEMEEKSKSEKFIRSPYKCEKCVKGFNFEDVLTSHMEKHSKKIGVFECDICAQYCPSKVSLRGHLKSHTTRYKCKVCDSVRISRQHLLEHYALAHTAAPHAYTCTQCEFTTNKRTMMQRHSRRHSANERVACGACGKLFNNLDSLRVHTIRHDASRSLQCELCNRKFIYPSQLHKHVQSVHVNKDYYCVECDVRFKSPENLKLHFLRTKKHRDISSFKHQCESCEQRFFTPSALSVHQAQAHGAVKQHSCVHCIKTYASKDALRAHVRRAHGGQLVSSKKSEVIDNPEVKVPLNED